MQSFLEQLADYHIQNHLTELSDICFVFPGRRAGLFFNRHLSQKINAPIWAPKTLTISELFNSITPIPVCDNISLVFRLHQCYQKIMKSDISIDDFIPFGEMLINDFNDIDKYLANPKKLFANLADIKALEDDLSYLNQAQIEAIRSFWSSFDIQKLSKHQEEFINTWENLFELYTSFRNELNNDGEAYEGMIYRMTAERIQNEKIFETPYKRIVFAGFNALNDCEKVMFNFLKIHKKASFFWDYPQWIMEQSTGGPFKNSGVEHEAVRFVKQNILDFPAPDNWQSPNPEQLPPITITSAPNDLVQAQIANKFFSNASVNPNITEENLALILADENQLFAALHAVPMEINSINVTLGYPLKSTPAYGLIENILTLQKSARTTKEGKTWFYHRPLLALLRHQYMTIVMGEKKGDLIQQIIASNHIFVEKDSLGDSDLTNLIFRKIETVSELTQYLSDLLLHVFKQLEKKENTEFEREFVFHLYTVVKRLSDIIAYQKYQPSPDTWLLLFRRIAEQETVPFKGEPLSGLQIMGLLETRALDFDKLIILSMNEGVFPRTSPPNSFIPYNLRKGHNLPTIDNQDAIFAYYFYRLINRASEVKLVYSTTKTVTGEGEMSRFLQQLYYEYPGEVKIETAIQQVNIPVYQKIEASKTPDVISIINQWITEAGQSLSPSALSTYIECPLRFYFKYIARIKEPDIIGEDLDPRVFGNLFHQILEKIYTPFSGQTINATDLQAILNNEGSIIETMNDVFVANIPFIREKSTVFADLQGKNSLIYEVLFKYIKQFLRKEMEATPFKLVSLEEVVNTKLTLSNGLVVNLGGTIDRTDIRNHTLRIIDYKTGQAGQTIKDVSELFDAEKHSSCKAIFQTLLYSLMASEKNRNLPIAPGVISVKHLFSKEFSMDLYLKPDKNHTEQITLELLKDSFTKHLNQLLLSLFDKEQPFTQTTCEKSCEYCLFKEHCMK